MGLGLWDGGGTDGSDGDGIVGFVGVHREGFLIVGNGHVFGEVEIVGGVFDGGLELRFIERVNGDSECGGDSWVELSECGYG